MESEKLQPIDLEVLQALYKKAYLPKSADNISKNLNIDYYYTLKIFNKLEKKGLCNQWIVNKKKEKETKNNYYKVCSLNEKGKRSMRLFKRFKSNKPTKKGLNNDHL